MSSVIHTFLGERPMRRLAPYICVVLIIGPFFHPHFLARIGSALKPYMEGLYGLIRHPQYTGLFIGLFGKGVIHWPTVFSVTLFPIIVIAYTVLAYREEKRMLKKFGEQYPAYKERTPTFFPGKPRWWQFIKLS